MHCHLRPHSRQLYSALITRTDNAPVCLISTKSSTAWMSYWWFNRFFRSILGGEKERRGKGEERWGREWRKGEGKLSFQKSAPYDTWSRALSECALMGAFFFNGPGRPGPVSSRDRWSWSNGSGPRKKERSQSLLTGYFIHQRKTCGNRQRSTLQ